ncbi:uncharacterized protein LDX57_001581 [Aspergillus melleus]|uniref:uncharacterized protein n=1 Tax=Aspergillus melleus TaxID=138277 RepID=UPI001E8E0B6B|nr:uncharacterized protein LDX57_001581 [Aspergillus melleus]KAH8423824.1 hypothetical protein LDX57_001581 [Aspergillus melleus]
MDLMLCDFLDQLANSRQRTGLIHILELGAGTGGTTTSVLETLVHRGVPFNYHFTDISSSFVMAARRKFATYASSNTLGSTRTARKEPTYPTRRVTVFSIES